MSRFHVTLALLLLALLPATAQAQPPKLSMPAAKVYVGKALKKRDNLHYRQGDAKRIGGCKRINSTRVRCKKVSWFVGSWDAYSGWVTIWYSMRGDRLWWNYGYQIKKLDMECWIVEENPKSSCTKTFRVV